MTQKLSQYFSVKTRYSRSINLERDLQKVEALEGYILTDRAINALKRILMGLSETPGNRAWTLTSVYGTGKSAFANYLACLFSGEKKLAGNLAREIAQNTLRVNSVEWETASNIPGIGYITAVATGQREPIAQTIIRALLTGIETFFSSKQQKTIKVISVVRELESKIAKGELINNKEIISIIKQVATTAKTKVFFIIDELGKNLEYTALNQESNDLYLLQQLAELPKDENIKIYFLGILHQAFAEYSQRLAANTRNDWAKIQGRFEDIPFSESPAQMINVISQAIDHSQAESILSSQYNTYKEWLEHLQSIILGVDLTFELLQGVYPLHPITALVLPNLCYRYAQNDRSLFTFLTSAEPYSLKNFLEEVTCEQQPLPTLKLDRVYDYFVETAGMGLVSRYNLQRWVEIENLIADAQHQDDDTLKVLKTIGILNLVTVTGGMRATRKLVALAVSESPSEDNLNFWYGVINELLRKGIVTHRRQLDELRIWQGSDFNVDSELAQYLSLSGSSLVELLSKQLQLKPLIAQRHSYQTGTLRYLERRYVDRAEDLNNLSCSHSDSDGLIVYWVDEQFPKEVKATLLDGKPLILVCGTRLELLSNRSREVAALRRIQVGCPELQTDGVARQEVRYRLTEAQRLLEEAFQIAFNLSSGKNLCWFDGHKVSLNNIAEFNALVSRVCDQVYHQTPILWNELINRRELTSMGTKARRELIEAMLSHPHEENLGLCGNGPEVSMYHSLLKHSGIHRQEENTWGFYPPKEGATLSSFWDAIEEFCLQAQETPQTLNKLYHFLASPPYGIKQGAIPVIVIAVLLSYQEEIGLYKEGTFIPLLGLEHLELLVRYPERYGVKHFKIVGMRGEVLKELAKILRKSPVIKLENLRNATLLNLVTPLYQFVNRLPAYTKKTTRLGQEAITTLKALQETVEPDELLFTKLPIACGLNPIGINELSDVTKAQTLSQKLGVILRELNSAYGDLLSQCQAILYSDFGLRADEKQLRKDLQVRAGYVVNHCLEPTLKRFSQAALDDTADQKQWLEAILMIVADKPAESWTDEDVKGFEIKVADLARQFKNLEALQKEIKTETSRDDLAKTLGFEAQRITLTSADGQETHRLVWVDPQQDDKVEQIVNSICNKLQLYDENFRQTVLAKLSQRLLSSSFPDSKPENIPRKKVPKKSYVKN